MAGLFAARVLAAHFRDVLLLERDPLQGDGRERRGTPQSHHSHVLLASGARAIETLFPGISAEFVERGATSGDAAGDVRWFVEGGNLRRFSSGLQGFGMSRRLLERIVRARVKGLANVSLQAGSAACGLAMTTDKRRVFGVKTDEATFAADTVVDASGRGSRTPRWLREAGFAPPPEEKVAIELRYTTRLFRRRPDDLAGDSASIVPPTPYGKRGGAMVSQEHDRWIVTLVTHFGAYVPSELAGFIEFARTLPDSSIYDVIRQAEPIGDAQTIRVPASVRRRYDRLRRFPDGYLVLGDAISSFNPVYGQGMSVAALEAAALGDVLAAGGPDVARRFFARSAKIVDAAWAIAAGNDLRMPEAGGKRSVATAVMNSYVPRLLRAGHHDPSAARAFLNVSNLLASPLSLLQPSLLWSAVRADTPRNGLAK